MYSGMKSDISLEHKTIQLMQKKKIPSFES